MKTDELARQLYLEEKILRYTAGKADEYRELALRVELAAPVGGLVRTVHGHEVRPDAAACLATAEHFERRAAEQVERLTILRKLLPKR